MEGPPEPPLRLNLSQSASCLLAHVQLVHPIPIVFVLIATLGFSFAIDSGASSTSRLLLLLSMFGGQLAVGSTNEIVDVPLDRAAGRTKPLVTGEVRLKTAWGILIAGLALMVLASLPLGPGALGLCAFGNGIGVAYSFWFKRTMFAWLPYALALPLLPLWISSALDVSADGLLLLFPVGICAVLGVQIAQSLPDVEHDRSAGITTMTTRLGEEWSLAVCWGAMVLTALLVAFGRNLASFAAILPGIVCFAIAGNAMLWFFNPKSGVRAAFPVSALSAILLGFAWIAS